MSQRREAHFSKRSERFSETMSFAWGLRACLLEYADFICKISGGGMKLEGRAILAEGATRKKKQ